MWIMKRTFFFLVLLTLAAGASAGAKSTAKDGKKSLDNDVDKTSYVMGRNIAEQIKHSKMPVDKDSFFWGLRDGFGHKEPPIDPKELMAAAHRLTDKIKAEAKAKHDAEAAANGKASEAFLAKNAKRKGVKVTKSGLQYQVIKAGTGPKPTADDTVKVSYVGKLINGTVFDSSEKHGQPAEFPVNAVIPGWSEALKMMRVGAKWNIYIPAKLAYGESGTGPIGPNEALIFEVHLLAIEHKNQQKGEKK